MNPRTARNIMSLFAIPRGSVSEILLGVWNQVALATVVIAALILTPMMMAELYETRKLAEANGDSAFSIWALRAVQILISTFPLVVIWFMLGVYQKLRNLEKANRRLMAIVDNCKCIEDKEGVD